VVARNGLEQVRVSEALMREVRAIATVRREKVGTVLAEVIELGLEVELGSDAELNGAVCSVLEAQGRHRA
jgi:hypothetical protein